jgi:hypothetical protein
MAIPSAATVDADREIPYVPALSRAGWYKWLFFESLCEPSSLQEMVSGFCAESYKPGVLNQPDFAKQDKSEMADLAARATAIRSAAVVHVSKLLTAEMQNAQSQAARPALDQDVVLKLQSLQMQQQLHAQMNQNVVNGGIGFSQAAGNSYAWK